MKKQIVYPDFITRVFSTTFDIMIIAMLVSLFDQFLRKPICLWSLRDIIKQNSLDSNNLKQLEIFFATYQPSSNSEVVALLQARFLAPAIEMVLVIVYTLFFWFSYAKTPAKFILRLKIVDQITLDTPTKIQFIKRLAGMFIYPIGVWFGLFNKKRKTFHDIVSQTVVIKS